MDLLHKTKNTAMKKLYKTGEAFSILPKVGDIIEIDNGIFVVVKSVDEVICEKLSKIERTSIKIKTEIIGK